MHSAPYAFLLKIIVIFLLLTPVSQFRLATAQVKVSGIIVDSISFNAVPFAHIGVKGKPGGTVADDQGRFMLQLESFDTLHITAVGYIPLTFPVFFDQEDILILMREDVTLLREVTVFGNPILSPLIMEKREIVYRRPSAARLATGSGIAFDYFSKEQRQRRKLQRLVAANEKVDAYNNIITDPDFREGMQEKYKLSEDQYYQGVLSFNLNHIESIHDKNEDEVLVILNDYFCKISGRCR